jgi:hypothetical protein
VTVLTAISVLLGVWLGWSLNGYAARLGDLERRMSMLEAERLS